MSDDNNESAVTISELVADLAARDARIAELDVRVDQLEAEVTALKAAGLSVCEWYDAAFHRPYDAPAFNALPSEGSIADLIRVTGYARAKP